MYPCSLPAVSKKTPTMTPPGLIPDASLNPTVPGGSNDVYVPLLNRKECVTAEVSVYAPTIAPSGLFPPANVKVALGKSIVVYAILVQQISVSHVAAIDVKPETTSEKTWVTQQTMPEIPNRIMSA